MKRSDGVLTALLIALSVGGLSLACGDDGDGADTSEQSEESDSTGKRDASTAKPDADKSDAGTRGPARDDDDEGSDARGDDDAAELPDAGRGPAVTRDDAGPTGPTRPGNAGGGDPTAMRCNTAPCDAMIADYVASAGEDISAMIRSCCVSEQVCGFSVEAAGVPTTCINPRDPGFAGADSEAAPVVSRP